MLPRKFPRLARILLRSVLGLTRIVVLLVATLQIQQRVFRYRAEQPNEDVTAIQLRRTTFEQLGSMLHRWTPMSVTASVVFVPPRPSQPYFHAATRKCARHNALLGGISRPAQLPSQTSQVELTGNESRHRVRTPFVRCGAVLDFAKQFCARKIFTLGLPMGGTSGSVQRFPANPARPGREQR